MVKGRSRSCCERWRCRGHMEYIKFFQIAEIAVERNKLEKNIKNINASCGKC